MSRISPLWETVARRGLGLPSRLGFEGALKIRLRPSRALGSYETRRLGRIRGSDRVDAAKQSQDTKECNPQGDAPDMTGRRARWSVL